MLFTSLPAVRHGKLFYRYLEHDKTSALHKSAGKFEAQMAISSEAKSEIHWWLSNFSEAFMPIRVPPYNFLIITDASNLG